MLWEVDVVVDGKEMPKIVALRFADSARASAPVQSMLEAPGTESLLRTLQNLILRPRGLWTQSETIC